MVDPRFSTGLTRVTPQQFERQIQFLLKHDFAILTISDYLTRNKIEKSIAITFDDGYESVFQHAWPILKKYNIPATVFINPAFMGQFNTWDVNLGQRFRHMDWHHVKQLHEAGWEVGSHGMTHRDLTRLEKTAGKKELNQSIKLIERHLGSCSRVCSYPFGNVDASVADSARALHYKFGVTMGMFNKNIALNYSIRRTGIYRFDLPVFFKRKAFAKWTTFFIFIQIVLDKCSDATVFCKQKKWTHY
jgi:peptidoglycan/xylan/chitin deacetylase (PgdA/CDA1 family)